MAQPEPESSLAPRQDDGAADESAYLLRSRIDIAAVLRDIVRTRGLAHVHFGAGPDTLLTAFLAADARKGEIVFDCSGSERLNRELLRAAKLDFVSSHDRVKVSFTTGPARLVEHEGKPAFAVCMPDAMLRLQRREAYRVAMPVARPVRCVIPLERDGVACEVETRVHDISQGGVALIVQPGELPREVGARYPGCRIALPDGGNLVVTLESVDQHDVTLRDGRTMLRVGCRFVRPSPTAAALVQRYIMKLERDRRARV